MSSLEAQRAEYAQRKFLAMPLAGSIVWLIIGISGMMLPDDVTVWVLFIGTGCIAYIGMFLSLLTGENFIGKHKKKNTFDRLFMTTVVQSFLSYALAIPFFLTDYSSLPMTVGILTGTMWIPFSWVIQHWVGFFHGISRTVSLVALWYVFPDHRFIVLPFAIVVIYMITLIILTMRGKRTDVVI